MAQLVALILGGAVPLVLNVVGDDDVGTVASQLACDAEAGNGRRSIGFLWANVEGQCGGFLVRARAQFSPETVASFVEDDRFDEVGVEGGAALASRDDQDGFLRVFPEAPDNVGAGQEGFTDAAQGLDDASVRPCFQIAGDVFLDAGRLGEAENVLPDVADEGDERVLENISQRGTVALRSSC